MGRERADAAARDGEASATCGAPGGGSATGSTSAATSAPERASTGPAIVEQDDSTIVVPPGWRLSVGPAGTALLERGGR